MEELNTKIEELTKRINDIEQAQNVNMNDLLLDMIFSNKGSYDSTLTRSISLTGEPQSITVTENPINSLEINYKGTKYRILLYSIS